MALAKDLRWLQGGYKVVTVVTSQSRQDFQDYSRIDPNVATLPRLFQDWREKGVSIGDKKRLITGKKRA